MRVRFASCRANSRPMPEEAPVISALQSLSFIVGKERANCLFSLVPSARVL